MVRPASEALAGIKDRLAIPAISAPMFLVSGPELVKATCRNGVIGAFPFPNARTIATLDAWLDDLGRTLGADSQAVPYAVNLTTHRSYDRLADEIDLIRNHKPKIVITALGGPDPVLDVVQEYGGRVIADVNSLDHARKAAEKGVDGMALVSAGAGGHTGAMAGFAFVPAVREFFDGIVILAGSIGTGRAVRAAEVLGADLSYIGTSFIAAEESLATPEYRDMLVAATYNDLVLSNSLTGAYANYLRQSLDKMGVDYGGPAKAGSMDLSNSDSKIKAWRDVWSAGHGVGSVRRIEPAADIIARFKREYDAASNL
ncbi:nitronate monooxygenase family protein [Hyphomonas sp.]|uniref:NAD(P)H-dependent flavin oxidoreductase n=1 Tax=Hyphomonas sp. TaxID=87 RepID=UPI0025BEC937|nr:nitronate monooxygenase [Hyphomonas sp.]